MTAIEHHHFDNPRARWKAQYSRMRAFRHRHDGRGAFWKLAILGLSAFWATLAYGVYLLG